MSATIVIDLGCATHGPEESVQRLIDTFEPLVLFGFDPWSGLEEGVRVGWASTSRIPAVVVRSRRAAGTNNQGTPYVEVEGERAWDSTTSRAKNSRNEWGDGEMRDVETFDLAQFVAALPAGQIILKMDVEGAEFELIEHLIETDADLRLSLLLVEWHDHKMHDRGMPASHASWKRWRRRLEEACRCEIREWSN